MYRHGWDMSRVGPGTSSRQTTSLRRKPPPMARTLLPTPEDPDRSHGHPAAGSAPDEQALAGYGLGGHAQPAGDGPTSGHERLRYLPMLTCCYAVVLYDAASAQLVRRIIGM